VATGQLDDTASALTFTEDELDSTQRDLSGVRIELTETTNERDELAAAAEDVAAREDAVTKKEAELDAREEAEAKAAEDLKEETTLKDGYTYTVGETMKAGTYRANVTGGSCYWAIYVSGTNYGDIVENDLRTRGIITVTVSAGQDFRSERCGDWTKVG
jgi:hypothetical protein